MLVATLRLQWAADTSMVQPAASLTTFAGHLRQRQASLIAAADGAALVRLIGSRIVADREIAANVAMVHVTSLSDDGDVRNRPPGYRNAFSLSFSFDGPNFPPPARRAEARQQRLLRGT